MQTTSRSSLGMLMSMNFLTSRTSFSSEGSISVLSQMTCRRRRLLSWLQIIWYRSYSYSFMLISRCLWSLQLMQSSASDDLPKRERTRTVSFWVYMNYRSSLLMGEPRSMRMFLRCLRSAERTQMPLAMVLLYLSSIRRPLSTIFLQYSSLRGLLSCCRRVRIFDDRLLLYWFTWDSMASRYCGMATLGQFPIGLVWFVSCLLSSSKLVSNIQQSQLASNYFRPTNQLNSAALSSKYGWYIYCSPREVLNEEECFMIQLQLEKATLTLFLLTFSGVTSLSAAS